jgi:uncharacterized RDD family membrane protein YckC
VSADPAAGKEREPCRTDPVDVLGRRIAAGLIDTGAIVLRTLLRVVDWLPFYLVGFIVVLATGSRRRRLGDLAAKTSVARA